SDRSDSLRSSGAPTEEVTMEQAHDIPPDPAVAAIHRLVADAEAQQNDLDGFTGLLTDDAVIVNFGGRRVRGRAAIRDTMARALATPLADVVTTQEVEEVRFLRPDIAIVEC